MLVNRINNISNSMYFGVNLKSPKLNYSNDDFFIKIKGYGRNEFWAEKVKATADTAVNLIRKETSAENVLKYVTAGVRNANMESSNVYKRENTGVLRVNRDGWKSSPNAVLAYTPYYLDRYAAYSDRLHEVYWQPLKNPFTTKLGMTRPYNEFELQHSNPLYINNALNHIFNLCKKVYPKFIKQEITQSDMPELNETIAEIRWVLAHSTPWKRGSDAISNVFMRALYKSVGVKSYPVKKSTSLDMEAYCTELSEYKKNFVNYFEKPPEIVE